jgi:hypothetical protein
MTNPVNPIIYIDDFARASFAPPYNDWAPIVAAALASFDHLEDNLSDSPGGTIVFGPGRVDGGTGEKISREHAADHHRVAANRDQLARLLVAAHERRGR